VPGVLQLDVFSRQAELAWQRKHCIESKHTPQVKARVASWDVWFN
jgi:hypothetical protein